MTSFRLPPEQKPVLNQLVSVLPTVTVIELDIVIQEMRTVIDQVARALELVLAVILLAGALVLISGVRSSLDARLKESALMRALGLALAWCWGPCGLSSWSWVRWRVVSQRRAPKWPPGRCRPECSRCRGRRLPPCGGLVLPPVR